MKHIKAKPCNMGHPLMCCEQNRKGHFVLQKSDVPIPEGPHAVLVSVSPGGCSGLREG